jgi:alpha-1,6-mannosyltransferase
MHIVDTTLFFAPASGGVKRYLLAKHQFLASQRGIQHTIVVPGRATGAQSPGIVTVASPRIPGGHGYRIPLNMRHWSGVICDLKPDLIEAGDPYHPAWAALQAAHRLDVPPVAFAHSDLPRIVAMRAGRLAGRWADAYMRKLYSRFALVMAPSKHIAARLRGLHIQRVAIQPLGVDTAVFHPARRDFLFRAQLGLPPRARVLIYAGRLSAEKRIALLCRAVEELGDPYQLLIVGGDEKRRISARVTLLPYEADPPRLARLLASADALLHAGLHETFGLVLLEAMACGRPVIGVRSGAIPELVNDSVGRLADAGTAEHLAKAVRNLFDDDLDALGLSARRVVEKRYSWEPVFRQQLTRYARLVRPGKLAGAVVPA